MVSGYGQKARLLTLNDGWDIADTNSGDRAGESVFDVRQAAISAPPVWHRDEPSVT
jgi:hypothetical protein